MPEALLSLPISELSSLVARREISPVDLVRESIDNIVHFDPAVNAFISTDLENAMKAAKAAAEEIARGNHRGRLHGIPVAVKDNLYTQGRITTMGSKIHGVFVPDFSATVVLKLAEAGAISMGKTNLHEYALGVTSENPHFGNCHNPWDLSKTPGGSSGGSAAAVASGMVKGALGSDTSGSIRIPAAACGVVGLKPTYGRVSKHGCFPEAWTLDHVGPIASTVADAAIMLDAISGHDTQDTSCLALPPTRTFDALHTDIRDLVIGVEEDFFFDEVDAEIAGITRAAIQILEQMGATLKPINLSVLQHSVYALTVIDMAETTTVHASNMLHHASDYGADVRALIECGRRPSAVDYLQAQQIRGQIQAEFYAVFDQVDAIIAPTLPIRTPDLGAQLSIINGTEADTIESLMRLVGPANLVGLPSLSLPCGMLDSLPVGLQIIGPPLGEEAILRLGAALETATLMGAAAPLAGPYCGRSMRTTDVGSHSADSR